MLSSNGRRRFRRARNRVRRAGIQGFEKGLRLRAQPQFAEALEDSCDAQIVVGGLQEPVGFAIPPVLRLDDAPLAAPQPVERQHAREARQQVPAQQFILQERRADFRSDDGCLGIDRAHVAVGEEPLDLVVGDLQPEIILARDLGEKTTPMIRKTTVVKPQ